MTEAFLVSVAVLLVFVHSSLPSPCVAAGADDGFVVHPDTMKIWGTNQTTTLYFDEVLNVIQ